MAIRPKREGTDRNSETLNMRVDPKFDFALWFASEVLGQAKKVFVQRAVYAAIDGVKDERGRSWQEFWDASEGVRTLKLLRGRVFRADADEDRLLNFVQEHYEFFFDERDQILRANVEILWPHIDQRMKSWEVTRERNYWSEGRYMAEALEAAKIVPPTWPPARAEPGRPAAVAPDKPTDEPNY